MANPFDQFDEPAASGTTLYGGVGKAILPGGKVRNGEWDGYKKAELPSYVPQGVNPFDQFDTAPEAGGAPAYFFSPQSGDWTMKPSPDAPEKFVTHATPWNMAGRIADQAMGQGFAPAVKQQGYWPDPNNPDPNQFIKWKAAGNDVNFPPGIKSFEQARKFVQDSGRPVQYDPLLDGQPPTQFAPPQYQPAPPPGAQPMPPAALMAPLDAAPDRSPGNYFVAPPDAGVMPVSGPPQQSAPNPFDQFDAPQAAPQAVNPFDQFDAPATAATPQVIGTIDPNKSSTTVKGGVSTTQQLPFVADYTKNPGNWWANFAKGLPSGPAEIIDNATALHHAAQDALLHKEAELMTGDKEKAAMLVQLLNEHGNNFYQMLHSLTQQTNLAEQYKNFAKPDVPSAYGAGGFVGGALVPVAGGAKAGLGIAANLGRSAIQGAGMSAFQNAGEQARHNGTIVPGEVLASAAGGGLVGAAGGGVMMAAGAAVKNILGRISKKLVDVHQQTGTAGSNKFLQALEALGIKPEDLDAQSAAAMQHLQGDQPAAPATPPDRWSRSGPPVPPSPGTEPGGFFNPQGPRQEPPHMAASPWAPQQPSRLERTRAARAAQPPQEQAPIQGQVQADGPSRLERTRAARAEQAQQPQAQEPGTGVTLQGAAEVVQDASPDEAPEAIRSWAKEVLGIEPGADLDGPAAGPFRGVLHAEEAGRNKNRLAEHVDSNPIYNDPAVKSALVNIGTKKVNFDYLKAQYEDYLKRFNDQFGQGRATFKPATGGTITTKQAPPENTFRTNQMLAAVRDKLSIGVKEANSDTLEGLVSHNFSKSASKVPMPNNEADAANKLLELKKSVLAAEKAYKASKTDEVKAMLQKAGAQWAEHTGDKYAGFHAKVNIVHPEEGKPPVEFGLLYRKGAMEKVIPKNLENTWKALKGHIESLDKNREPGQVTTFDSRGAKFLEGSASFALNLWDHNPLSEFLGGLAVLHIAAPKVAKHILTEERFDLGAMWKDSMDNISYLEKSGIIPPGLAQTVWNHQAQVIKVNRGIKMDDNVRDACVHALREGVDPSGIPVDAKSILTAAGRAGTVFESLTDDEAKAFSVYKIAQQSLAKHLSAAHDATTDWIKNNSTAFNLRAARNAQEAVGFMVQQTRPMGGSRNAVDRLAGKAKSNFMDFAFFQNPEFSGTNLGDFLISGGSYCGIGNVLKANNLISFDRSFRSLYHNSNLAGGFSADRAGAANKAAGGLAKKMPWEVDFNSDLFNANRVHLGAILQFHQLNAQRIGGNATDFAKKLMSGDAALDPAIAAEAEIHAAKALSKVLGVDPYKVNTDILGRSSIGNAVGVFFKQPARQANLAINYLANGDFRSFYTLAGMATVFGGTAGIPMEMQTAGMVLNPDSYFKAAAAFDQMDMYQKVTGEKLTPKIQWGIFWAAQVGQNPVVDQISGASAAAGDAVMKGDADAGLKTAQLVLPLMMSRIFGVSTRFLINTGKNAKESFVDKKEQVWAKHWNGVIDFKDSRKISFEKTQEHPMVHFLRQYVPGKSPSAYQLNQSVAEHETRRGMIPKMSHGLITGVRPEGQYYDKRDIGSQPNPWSFFLGGGQ